MATFSTSHTCHMWRISDFSTSVIWTHLKFLHMWKNFQFPHNIHTWKADISPHDNFFSTNIIRDIRDKHQVCAHLLLLDLFTASSNLGFQGINPKEGVKTVANRFEMHSIILVPTLPPTLTYRNLMLAKSCLG